MTMKQRIRRTVSMMALVAFIIMYLAYSVVAGNWFGQARESLSPNTTLEEALAAAQGK